MSTIFLSYARKDHFFAELARMKLESEGIRVWSDVGQLRAGDDWRNEIDFGISQCLAVLVALSPNSAESAYVTYEWASAIGKNKAIIPVLLEPCTMHPRLEPIQYIDFSNSGHLPWTVLVERIQQIADEVEAPMYEVDDAPEAPPAAKEDQPVKPKSREAEAEKKILDYLNERGFQMVSFERIREKIDQAYDDDFLKDLVRSQRHTFRPARLKGARDGLAKL